MTDVSITALMWQDRADAETLHPYEVYLRAGDQREAILWCIENLTRRAIASFEYRKFDPRPMLVVNRVESYGTETEYRYRYKSISAVGALETHLVRGLRFVFPDDADLFRIAWGA